jgi:signal transduction histidine kinase
MFIVYRDHHPNALVSMGIDKELDSDDLVALDVIIPRVSQGSVLLVDQLRTAKSHDEKKAYAVLSKRHIALILPLASPDEIIGYFMLGEHMTSMYSRQDMATLNATANELVIAVQNARSIQALRDLNTNLEKRINDATHELRRSNDQLRQADEAKDEFVSMASHQLRTPLTSIKGYISMVLEGDAGKITPMQKKLLGEAFTSSERMVHLIGDFLNVSRLQTGKFVLDKSLVNLADLIEEEVDSLKETARTRSLKLQYHKPSRVPSLYIDGGKIHQVIMNFIDNAIYYSTEHTTITVRLAVEDGDVLFEVDDTGIGVPKSQQVRLFTKFFRATNARKQRPDGTGIGLFLAKKVIDAHGGNMVFESIEGEGSTFGFRLPIKKLSEAPNEPEKN